MSRSDVFVLIYVVNETAFLFDFKGTEVLHKSLKNLATPLFAPLNYLFLSFLDSVIIDMTDARR